MAGNRRTLGVQLDEMTVVEVEDGSAGQKGGMKEGDEILKVDGKVSRRQQGIWPRHPRRRAQESGDRASQGRGS